MIDVDAVVRELYGLRPGEFTAARDEQVARARKDGDAAAAKEIGRLRKPTRSAWCSNVLVRSDQAHVEQLLQLGQALREAHRTLAGEELRELSHQQHVVIAAMAREACRLAAEAGQPVSETVQREVEQILHTVLADEDAARQWARGTLAKPPPAPVGFTGLQPAPGATPPRAPAARAPGAPAGKAGRPEPAKKPPRPTARQRAGLERATAEAERARQEAEQAEEALGLAEADLEQTRAARAALDERVASLEEQLGRLTEERDRAAEAADAADRHHRDASRAAQAARKAADRAARAQARLQGGTEV
ncbi:hypothetical protein [Streptomyces sp. NPDC051211]|uniref:hypothetical protein n=1 Tax=Streptomyces sp. NPDC051211 TaxID=3154643 RepID=UPI00344FB59E